MKFRFHPAALQEYADATQYYLNISPQLAQSFISEIEKTISRIRRTPKGYSVVIEDVRRCLANRFPYGIYFTIDADYILLVAVMHLSRQPGYWMKRI